MIGQTSMKTTTIQPSSRYQGTVEGLAWGDVLGAPIESWSRSEIQQVYGSYDELPETIPFAKIAKLGCHRVKQQRPLGLHTDDTQQALALIQATKEPGALEVSWARILVSGYEKGSWRGTGSAFRSALEKLTRGISPKESGTRSAGIGSAMRTSLLGLLDVSKTELADIAMRSSLVTHGDLRAASLSYAVAQSVASLIAEVPIETIRETLPQQVFEVAKEWNLGHKEWNVSREDPHAVSESLSEVFRLAPLNSEELRRLVLKIGERGFAGDKGEMHPNHPYSLLGGIHALGSAIARDGAPPEILKDIMNIGGDTDTVGAITASLLGARYGNPWIPHQNLKDRAIFRGYAKSLHRKLSLPESPSQLLERERKWSEIEKDFRKIPREGC